MEDEMNSMMRSVNAEVGDFSIKGLLNKGSTGQVFHILTSRHQRALKVIWRVKGGKDLTGIERRYQNEWRVHEGMDCPHIVRLLMHFQDQHHFYLILQFCEKGNLAQELQRGKPSIERTCKYGLQIIKAIQYMHSNGVIHGDIRPGNILLTADQAKICDFGQSAKLNKTEKTKLMRTACNRYLSPQVFQPCDQKVDIWAYGCILYELATGKPLFQFTTFKDLANTLSPEFIRNITFDPNIPQALLNLLKSIFIYDPLERISALNILNHPFFTGEELQKEPNHSTKENHQIYVKEPNHSTKENHQIYVKEPNHSTKENANPNIKPLCFSNTKAVVARNRCPSPLSTSEMKVKPVGMERAIIHIDEKGLTREDKDPEGNSLFLNVSPEGEAIRIRKGNIEKCYNLNHLPQKYWQYYEDCKNIVRIIKDQTVRVSFKTPHLAISLMYSGRVTAQINGAEVTSLENDPRLMDIYRHLLQMSL